jgi:hypothetical protein
MGDFDNIFNPLFSSLNEGEVVDIIARDKFQGVGRQYYLKDGKVYQWDSTFGRSYKQGSVEVGTLEDFKNKVNSGEIPEVIFLKDI